MKSKSIFILAAIAGVLSLSCVRENPEQPETVADVSYNPVKGLIPNKTVTVAPQVENGEPGDFAIQSVYYGEIEWKGTMFSIDSKSGEVTVAPPVDIKSGDYYLSISCKVEGVRYIFSNALVVSIIPGMPEVSINPASLDVRFEDLATDSDASLPFVSIAPQNEAAPITGLEIRNVRKNGQPLENGTELFATDYQQGTISPVKSDDWTIGTYVADLKINTETYPSESETGLIADAVTFKVEAKPVVLTYPEAGAFYQNIAQTYTAAFADAVPTDVAIKAVTLDGQAIQWDNLFSIDANANISVAKLADAKVGEYKVSVSYKYAGQDLSSDDVLCVRCIAGMPESLSSTDFKRLFEPAELAEGSAAIDGFKITPVGESAQILSYSIAGASLNGAKFEWNEKMNLDSDVLNLVKGTWAEGDYSIDIRCVTASFDETYEKGVFESVIQFSVYNAVTLTYDNASKKEHAPWEIVPSTPMPSMYTYAFTDPSASYVSELKLDPATGAVSAVKGNNLEKGEYSISITASSAGRQPSTGVFTLTIVENPYYFTYFSYGNNLGLTEAESSGVSQFRLAKKAEIGTLKPEIKYTDLPESGKDAVTYSMEIKENLKTAAIDSKTGALSFTTDSWANYQNGLLFVIATTVDPEDAANSFSVKMPVFFHFANMNPAKPARNVAYYPFVLRVNPLKGGKTTGKPVITGVEDESKFLIDFRRDFRFWTLDGNTSLNTTTNPLAPGQLLYTLWTQYDWGETAPAYGSNNPVSYFSNGFAGPKTQEQLDKTFAYFDNANDFAVVVNADMWIDKSTGYAANGVFICQIATTNDGAPTSLDKTGGNCAVGRPFIIWLDPNFE